MGLSIFRSYGHGIWDKGLAKGGRYLRNGAGVKGVTFFLLAFVA